MIVEYTLNIQLWDVYGMFPNSINHSVRSPFVSTFRLSDCQETGSIFLQKISTFGGNPPSLTVFVWALSFAYRIRKQIHHREDIRIRTHSIKPKPSPLRCKRRKYPQGGILYPLQSPPPRTKSRFYYIFEIFGGGIL